ncbi:cytochrome c oxidase subunit II [Rubrivirga sp. IMCC45206]|uniref:cytochrome c oxidase subunit II n=1 Tax=Rubrivirga sp. IMCC45206 TaxID=3391614 RepID=UPI00398FD802
MQTDSTAAALERTSLLTEGGTIWLPPQSSTTAHEIDALFYFILYASIVLTLLVAAAMVYFVWKYRRKSHADRPVDVIESKWLETSWVVIPSILVLVVFFWGFRAYVGTAIPPSDAITINVKAQKWAWTFEYQNGIQGFNEIWVPVGTPVRLEMTSQDVLHSFFVPEFRIKHDVIPNRYAYVWFEAPREGTYQVLCTEYCGTAHSNMGAKIHVVSRAEYYAVLRDGPPGQGPVPPVELGELLYTQRNCNNCHSVDGTAGVGPSWLNVWGQPRPGSASGVFDEAYTVESILYPQTYIVPGYENGNMPSYDGALNEEQVAGLAAYIRAVSGASLPSDLVLPEDAGVEQSTAGQPPEGGMGDPSVPVADPVAPGEREAVRQDEPLTVGEDR